MPRAPRTAAPTAARTHKWVELRGLMVLRYCVERQTIENYGLDATRSLINRVQIDMGA